MHKTTLLKTMVIDPDPRIHEAFSYYFSTYPEYSLCGMYRTAEEALEKAIDAKGLRVGLDVYAEEPAATGPGARYGRFEEMPGRTSSINSDGISSMKRDGRQ